MTPPIVLFDDPRLTNRATDIVLNHPDDAAAIRMVGQYAGLLTGPTGSKLRKWPKLALASSGLTE